MNGASRAGGYARFARHVLRKSAGLSAKPQGPHHSEIRQRTFGIATRVQFKSDKTRLEVFEEPRARAAEGAVAHMRGVDRQGGPGAGRIRLDR